MFVQFTISSIDLQQDIQKSSLNLHTPLQGDFILFIN